MLCTWIAFFLLVSTRKLTLNHGAGLCVMTFQWRHMLSAVTAHIRKTFEVDFFQVGIYQWSCHFLSCSLCCQYSVVSEIYKTCYYCSEWVSSVDMSKWTRYHYVKIVIMLEYKITNWHLQGPLSLGLLKCIKGFCRYIQRYRTGLGIFPSHWSCRSAMFAAFLRPSFLFPCLIIRNSRSPSLANKRNLETKSLRLEKKYV